MAKRTRIRRKTPSRIEWAKRRLHADIEHITAASVAKVVDAAVSLAAVDTGYMRASIHSVQLGRYHWQIRVGAFYGIFVEFGTRNMAAQPFLRPAAKGWPAFVRSVSVAS